MSKIDLLELANRKDNGIIESILAEGEFFTYKAPLFCFMKFLFLMIMNEYPAIFNEKNIYKNKL